MKKILAITFFTFLIFAGFSQNLVVNPSFENTASNCANFGGEGFTTDALNWDDVNSGADSCSSPDLFSACNTLGGFPSPTHMPNSVLGYRQSKTGTRHAGIITYEAPGAGCTPLFADNYREYIQGQLSSPLVAGQTYCVSMHVSLGGQVLWATNNIGIHFRNTNYQRNPCPGTTNSLISNLTPQLNYNCTPLLDTLNWVRLQWNYTAAGGEQFFIIGNFFSSANTQVACNNSSAGALNPYAYYYIDDVSVEADPCCFADITPVGPFCETDVVTNLTAIAPYDVASCSYNTVNGTWSGPGITNAAAGTFDPSVAGAGTHTINLHLACGDSASTEITVNICANLDVCVEPNGQLTVSNGTGPYTWQNTVSYQDCSNCFPAVPPLIQPCSQPPGCAVMVDSFATFTTGTTINITGNFPLKVIDNQGNELIITDTATLAPCSAPCPTITPAIDAQTNVTCSGGNNGSATISATGGAAPYTYTWSPGSLTGDTQTGLSAGAYGVTVTDDNNCTATITINISEPLPIVLNTSASPATCGNDNGTAVVSVSGTTNYTVEWNTVPVQSTDTITGLAGGNYIVTVTDTAGCIAVDSATVTSTNNFNLSLTSTNTTCDLVNGSAIASVTGGAIVSFTWSDGQLGDTAVGLAPGVYSVTADDGLGCTGTASVTVGAEPLISISLQTSDVSCNQPTGAISVTTMDSIGSVIYSWSDGQFTNPATSLSPGTYSVTVVDSAGCIAVDSASVLFSNNLTVNSSSTPTTCGDTNGTATASVSGGGTISYIWSNGQTTATITGLASGNYSVTADDGLGCTGTVSVIVGTSPAVSFSLQATQASCGFNTGEISANVTSATGGVVFNWSNGENAPGITSLAPGTYTVIVTDSVGCVGVDSAVIAATTGISLIVETTNANCDGEDGTATVTASGAQGGYNYAWSGSNSSAITATGLTPGTNSVTVTSADSCVAVEAFTISQLAQVFITAGPDTTISGGNQVQLTATGAADYIWSPSQYLSCTDCVDPVATPEQSIVYYVTGTNADGCSGSDSVEITVLHETIIIVPTAFSPNGDMNNDVLRVLSRNISKIEFRIFNRWGEEVFYTESINSGWDGKYKGKDQPIGTFVYTLVATTTEGEVIRKVGNITLVR